MVTTRARELDFYSIGSPSPSPESQALTISRSRFVASPPTCKVVTRSFCINGSLSQAVRASMAIPGVFTPVEIDGRMLADGGMVQNIPVETVLEMDSDLVIAVELRLPPGESKN